MPIYTVSQVTQYLKQLLVQDEHLGDLWISGEVSNLRVSQSGHAFFTLKDPESQLQCVMFRGGNGMDLLEAGAAITVHGHISFYEARGTIDLVADIVMVEGVGPLALEYEKLKATLEVEGLFDPSRKRPLPRFPRTIGVVTSPTGAVFQDICNVLGRRFPLVEVQLAPTLVQGPEAAQGIIRALKLLNDDGSADLIILARGGGSLEELWAFNEEPVARAIYASRIPVVSAVGHETDYTIADYVADVRAPTPSAAAEMVVPDRASLQGELLALNDRLYWAASSNHSVQNDALTDLMSRLTLHVPDVESHRRRVDDLSQQVARSTATRTSLLSQRIEGLQLQLKALNPGATLHRGYSVVQKETSGEVVSRLAQVKVKEPLKVTVSDGAFPAVARDASRRKRTKKELAYSDARLFS